jgi:hypothetical protein
MDEAAPLGSAQQVEREQDGVPEIGFGMDSDDEWILLLRSWIIESAGEPKSGGVGQFELTHYPPETSAMKPATKRWISAGGRL